MQYILGLKATAWHGSTSISLLFFYILVLLYIWEFDVHGYGMILHKKGQGNRGSGMDVGVVEWDKHMDGKPKERKTFGRWTFILVDWIQRRRWTQILKNWRDNEMVVSGSRMQERKDTRFIPFFSPTEY